MASLRLPEPLIAGLSKIPSLTEESIQEILSVLENYPPTIQQHRVFNQELGAQLKTIPPDIAKSVMEALYGLYAGRAGATITLQAYIQDVAEALQDVRRDSTAWAQSDETLTKFKERLTRLLSVEALNLVSKAYDILLEHSQTLSDVRVISDIRPVFGQAVEGSPQAAVIVHMLKIDYREAGRPKEFFVALDTKDLQYLMDALTRAQSKTESLKAVLATSGMTYIEVV